jgi:hypothetical protein
VTIIRPPAGALLLEDAESRAIAEGTCAGGRPSVSDPGIAGDGNTAGIYLAREHGPQSKPGSQSHQGRHVRADLAGAGTGGACVDNSEGGTLFTADDLRLMLAVATTPPWPRHRPNCRTTFAATQPCSAASDELLAQNPRQAVVEGCSRPTASGGEKSEVVILNRISAASHY